jgi:8-oxo-dGTP diphosphatase
MIGVIPAAGRASRMGQIGAELPKALIEIDGRTLLDRSIDTLEALGVSRIVVVVGHLGEKIVDRKLDVDIAYQERPLGLAHAIATANPDDDFVVLCPDNIYTTESDLTSARQIFEASEAAFVLLATVTPNTQRDRKSYFTSAHRNLEPNVYDYRNQNESTTGLPMNSTGCVFFKRDALDFLPSFAGSTREHIFRDYLDAIVQQREALLYLLRGMRYDFSGPEDIEQYVELKKRLGAAKDEQGVSAILLNPAGQVLLQQRDENPAIRYPGHWSLFGGTIEDGESAAEAVAREVREEIDFELRNFGLFREFVQNNKREFAFAGELTARLDELTLSEGQAMNFFYPSQLRELQIRPDDKETLEQYFGA